MTISNTNTNTTSDPDENKDKDKYVYLKIGGIAKNDSSSTDAPVEGKDQEVTSHSNGCKRIGRREDFDSLPMSPQGIGVNVRGQHLRPPTPSDFPFLFPGGGLVERGREVRRRRSFEPLMDEPQHFSGAFVGSFRQLQQPSAGGVEGGGDCVPTAGQGHGHVQRERYGVGEGEGWHGRRRDHHAPDEWDAVSSLSSSST